MKKGMIPELKMRRIIGERYVWIRMLRKLSSPRLLVMELNRGVKLSNKLTGVTRITQVTKRMMTRNQDLTSLTPSSL